MTYLSPIPSLSSPNAAATADETALARPQLVDDVGHLREESSPTKPSLAASRDEDLDSGNNEDVILARPEWGSVAMLAAAASFGASVPGAVSSAYAELFRSVERHGEFSISNGGGPIGQLTKEEIAAKKQEEDGDGWTDWARDMSERHEERERREREQAWDKGTHDFAGMQMSGEDIDALMDFIRDPAQRQKLIERRARDKGISTQQAAKDVDNAARYGELFKKIEDGTATREEKAEYARLNADPNVRETVKYTNDLMKDTYAKPDAAVSNSQRASTNDSTSSGADVLDNPFPSAPPVKEHFADAKAAITPLDVKPAPMKDQLAMASPATPSPQLGQSGFDG